MNGWPPAGQVPEVVADDDEKGSFQVIILVRGWRTNGAGATRGMDALHECWKTLQKKYDADNRREAAGAPTKTMSPAS